MSKLVAISLFFAFSFYPSVYSSQKLILLIASSSFSLFYLFQVDNLKFPKLFSLALFVWIFFFLFSLYYGVLNGCPTPDIRLLFRFFLLLPLCIPISRYLSLTCSPTMICTWLLRLNLVLLFCLFIFTFFPSFVEATPLSKYIFHPGAFGGGLIDYGDVGRIETRARQTVPLILLSSISVFTFFSKISIPRPLSFACVFMNAAYIVVSGRRALQYSFILSFLISFLPLLISYLRHLRLPTLPSKFNRLYFFAVLTVLLIFSFVSYKLLGKILTFTSLESLSSLWLDTVLAPLNPDSNTFQAKDVQSSLFLLGFLDSPFLGHGLTCYLSSYIRNIEAPWSYETFYYSLAYQSGILGLFSFFFLVAVSGKVKEFFNGWVLGPYTWTGCQVLTTSCLIFLMAASSNPFWDNPMLWIILFYSYFAASLYPKFE